MERGNIPCTDVEASATMRERADAAIGMMASKKSNDGSSLMLCRVQKFREKCQTHGAPQKPAKKNEILTQM
jgi:hypothetical protein